MNLEQAIKRTQAVIGLPECGVRFEEYRHPYAPSSPGADWSAVLETAEGIGERLPDSAAFALLRDHAHQAILARRWYVDGPSSEGDWCAVRDVADNPISQSKDVLDAMLTALEEEARDA